jgi:hypothetical protein
MKILSQNKNCHNLHLCILFHKLKFLVDKVLKEILKLLHILSLIFIKEHFFYIKVIIIGLIGLINY